jgi:hypothetical protein
MQKIILLMQRRCRRQFCSGRGDAEDNFANAKDNFVQAEAMQKAILLRQRRCRK